MSDMLEATVYALAAMATSTYVHVFYAGQLLTSFEDNTSFQNWRRMQPNCWPEVYNGSYVFGLTNQTWWRMDLTPVLLEDVPKELRALALLLT